MVNYAAGEPDEDADSTPASLNADMICAAVSSAVSAGIHAAIDAIGEPGVEGSMTVHEAELLDAYRNAGELHRTTALRTLKRAMETKDDS